MTYKKVETLGSIVFDAHNKLTEAEMLTHKLDPAKYKTLNEFQDELAHLIFDMEDVLHMCDKFEDVTIDRS